MKNGTAVLLSYLLGCINVGYYYVRYGYQQDIREIGTRVTGATNVSRLAGNRGFIITLTGDALKGMAAVGIGRWLQVSDFVLLICIFSVAVGHIFPIQLKFKGGKGFAATAGALLVYSPVMLLVALTISGGVLLFVKRRTISVLIALWIMPPVLWAMNFDWHEIGLILALDGVFLYAFRENIRGFWQELRNRRKGGAA